MGIEKEGAGVAAESGGGAGERGEGGLWKGVLGGIMVMGDRGKDREGVRKREWNGADIEGGGDGCAVVRWGGEH